MKGANPTDARLKGSAALMDALHSRQGTLYFTCQAEAGNGSPCMSTGSGTSSEQAYFTTPYKQFPRLTSCLLAMLTRLSFACNVHTHLIAQPGITPPPPAPDLHSQLELLCRTRLKKGHLGRKGNFLADAIRESDLRRGKTQSKLRLDLGGREAHGVLEGLEQQLVGQQVHRQLLVSEGVQAGATGTAGSPHLHLPEFCISKPDKQLISARAHESTTQLPGNNRKVYVSKGVLAANSLRRPPRTERLACNVASLHYSPPTISYFCCVLPANFPPRASLVQLQEGSTETVCHQQLAESRCVERQKGGGNLEGNGADGL